MAQNTHDQLPLACNMGVFTPAERAQHEAIVGRLREALTGGSTLPDGRRFGLRPDAGNVALLAEFIEGERRCCPFFEFTVRLEQGGAALWLDLTGPEGIHEFISEEFDGMA